jgi:hypothetical protein
MGMLAAARFSPGKKARQKAGPLREIPDREIGRESLNAISPAI